MPRGRPRKNPLPPSSPQDHWAYAKNLQRGISPHYAMDPPEQELAFYAALSLETNSHILELGVTNGHTAITLAYAAKQNHCSYTGIDNFLTEGSPEEIKAHFQAANLKGEIIRGNTNQFKLDFTPNLILFDAGHDHFNMAADCAFWLPRLKPGGLALFHAYNRAVDYTDPHFPVKNYADQHTKTWEEVAYIPYLMVRRKPL